MKQNKYLIFAGTREGRELFAFLNGQGIAADISVATAYGKELLPAATGRVFTGRLSAEAIQQLLCENAYQAVVDATHPYACSVTEHVQSACTACNTPYLRLLRASTPHAGVISCNSFDEVAAVLNRDNGNILSTIGTKELHQLCAVRGYRQRVFARVLPTVEAIEQCSALGLMPQNLICMQGPFSVAFNKALLEQFSCQYLLTKDSGHLGGLEAKLQAAQAVGATVVLLERPIEESGYSYEALVTYLLNGNEKIGGKQ